MTKAKLYQFAIIWNPNEKQQEEGKRAKLLVEPTTILSTSDQQVLITASMAIPSEHKDDLDQIDIVVRPF